MKKFFPFLTAAAILLAASCSKSDDLDAEIPQPENEIWYTSSDSSVVMPSGLDKFNAKVLSNIYDIDKGVILFDKGIFR